MKHPWNIAFILIAAFSVCAADLSDDEWAGLRERALNRPRRIIINNDGCDVTNFPADKSATRENVYAQMMNLTRGREIDTISYCPFGVGFQLTTRTRASERYTTPETNADRVNLAPELYRQKTDALQLAVEFCRANGFEIFASMRVNDAHEQWHPALLSKFKKAHPELLVGSDAKRPPVGMWTAFDFNHRKVRDLFVAINRELMAEYDVDGLELDFLRFPVCFKSVAWGGKASEAECALITEMMREIRAAAEEIGRTRGKPLILAVRVPDSVALAKALGFDLEAWFQNGSVDLVYAGADWWRYAPLSELIGLGHKYKLKVYPSVDVAWSAASGKFERNTPAQFAAQSAAAFAAGADGIYYFNMFYAPNFFPLIRRNPDELAKLSKRYFYRYAVNQDFILRDHAAYNRIPELTPGGIQLLAAPGKPLTFSLELGDERGAEEAALYVDSVQDDNRQLAATFNGVRLGEPVKEAGGVFRFAVAPALLKVGENTLELASASAGGDRLILSGRELLKGRNQPPWRRLFPVHDFRNAEKIVDGAYRLADTGTGRHQMANLFYPIPNLAGTELRIGFELKVESSSAPEAVAVRVANGEFVELITLEPGKIGLAYAGKSKPFRVGKEFHRYAVSVKNGRLTLKVDDALLFDEALVAKVTDPATRLNGTDTKVKQMDEQSVIFGSLSGPGRGTSLWKKIHLGYDGTVVSDIALEVKHPPVAPARLTSLIASPGKPLLNFAPRDGRVPTLPGVAVKYAPGGIAVKDNVMLLNHDNPADPFGRVEMAMPEHRPGILAADWKFRPEDAGQKSPLFQFVLWGKDDRGAVRQFRLQFSGARVETPWGDAALRPDADGWFDCRLLFDPADGNALLVVNGRNAGYGAGVVTQETPSILFGDGSRAIAGRAALAHVSVSVFE